MVKNTYGDCKIVPATEEHIEGIAAKMRVGDQLECACFGFSPQDALYFAMSQDDRTHTVLDGAKVPFAMFGAGSRKEGDGSYIWLLGTDGVFENKRQFAAASRPWVNYLVKPYGVVSNLVHKENAHAVRWLRFCGAKFVRELQVLSNPFYEFIITSN